MLTVAIPQWDIQGLLPPIDPVDPVSAERSTCQVSLLDLVLRFATSPDRCKVLKGFLAYRAVLHLAGLTEGFQWINGSFTEHVETLEHRSPNDIDVVTFLKTPDDFLLTDDQLDLLEPDAAKKRFLVDSYFVEINRESPDALIERSIYWYGVWSHRRNMVWKGYLRIDLDPTEDGNAQRRLDLLESQMVQT